MFKLAVGHFAAGGGNFPEIMEKSPWAGLVHREIKLPFWLTIWPWIGPEVVFTCTVVYRLARLRSR